MSLMDAVERLVISALGRAPSAVQSLIATGITTTNSDGDELEPEVGAALRLLNALPDSDFSNLEPEQAREQIEHESALFGGAPIEMNRVERLTIPTPTGEIEARRYLAKPADEARLLIYLHGGGWVVGSIDSHDALCRFLAHHAGVSVLSVGYRLAPEYPFPTAPNDVRAAYDFALQATQQWGHDPELIAVAGDSAGGNLATVLCQDVRRDGGQPPALQLLFYPVTDLRVPNERRSYREFAEGYFLTAKQMDWYRDHYTGGENLDDPRVSPLLAEDLSGLPPAHVVTAGFDPLRDEGEEYAAALSAAGNEVSLRRHPGLIHGFVNSAGVGRTPREALLEACGVIRQGLRVGG